MLLTNHYQNAYVTRDLDRALALLRARHGVDGFTRYAVDMEVNTPGGRGRVVMKLALGWVGALQYELIEPVSGLVDIYRDALSEYPLQFHHVCMRVHDWDTFRADLDRQQRPVVIEGGTPGHLQFVYVDARDSLGHYLEYCWMTPERWAAAGGR